MSSLKGFLVKQGYLVKTNFRIKQAFWSNRAEGFPGKTCQKGLLVDLQNALHSRTCLRYPQYPMHASVMPRLGKGALCRAAPAKTAGRCWALCLVKTGKP